MKILTILFILVFFTSGLAAKEEKKILYYQNYNEVSDTLECYYYYMNGDEKVLHGYYVEITGVVKKDPILTNRRFAEFKDGILVNEESEFNIFSKQKKKSKEENEKPTIKKGQNFESEEVFEELEEILKLEVTK